MSYNNQARIINDHGYSTNRYLMLRFHPFTEKYNDPYAQPGSFLYGILKDTDNTLGVDGMGGGALGGGLYLFRGDTTAYYQNMCMTGSINRNTSVIGKIRFVLGAETFNTSDDKWQIPLSVSFPSTRPASDTFDAINSSLAIHGFNLAPAHVSYYYAEIDFVSRVFSIGYYNANKSTILKRVVLPQSTFINGNLTFTIFDKENSTLELSAKFVRSTGQTFELTADLAGRTSGGQFGVYVFNPLSPINNFNFGVRGANNKYIICKPAQKSYKIRFVYDNTIKFDVQAHLAKVVDGVNRIFENYFLNTNFSISEFVPETFTDNDPFTYSGFGEDFNYAVIAGSTRCTCGGSCAVGCAYYPGLICSGVGWISLRNSINLDITLLAHELGHSLGAAHVTNPNGTIMFPSLGNTSKYAPISVEEISAGIAGPCYSKADITPAIEEYEYVPPPPPEPPQPPQPPTPPDTFSSFIFTKQFPETLRLLDNEDSISLLVSIWPVNNRGVRLSQAAADKIVAPCRSSAGCYVWERRYDNGSWSTIQSLKAPEGRKYNAIFSLPSQYSSMQIRCIVTIQGVTKTSNVCTILRRQTNTKYTFTNYIENFIYPADLSTYQLNNLPELVKQCLLYITTKETVGTSQIDATVWSHPTLTYRYKSKTSWNMLLAGKQYTIIFRQPGPRPAGISVANLPITIDWVPNLGGVGAAAAEVVTDNGEIPTYNVDSSWSATVNNNDTILLDKQMVIPIESITNIENVNKIYTQQDNKLYFWKKNYSLSNLETLNYNTVYTFELNTTNPVELSYEVTESTPSPTPPTPGP